MSFPSQFPGVKKQYEKHSRNNAKQQKITEQLAVCLTRPKCNAAKDDE